MVACKRGIVSLLLVLVAGFGFAQKPTAHFYSDCKILCLNGPAGLGNTTLNFFYDGTGGTPTSYTWTFPNGANPATSTTKNPSNVNFSTFSAGTYYVKVTATNGSGS